METALSFAKFEAMVVGFQGRCDGQQQFRSSKDRVGHSFLLLVATSNKCHATRNKCLTSSNNKNYNY